MKSNNDYSISFFRRPITNKQPAGGVTPFWVYQYLRSPLAKDETSALRHMAHDLTKHHGEMTGQQLTAAMTTVKENQRRHKGSRLDYVTPSGVFAYCNDNSLVSHSRLLCMDLDDIMPLWEVNPVFYDFGAECYNNATKETDAVEMLKWRLARDRQFNTVLAFRSPRGNGLKWWLEIDLEQCDHLTWFHAVRNYLMACYGLTDHQVDKMCGNVSRACYLNHDPLAYLRDDLIENYAI